MGDSTGVDVVGELCTIHRDGSWTRVVPRRDGRVADTVPYNAMYGIHGEVGETLYHT